MRRVGGLIEQIASPDNLREAWLKTVRGKRLEPSVLRFRENLNENLREIGEDLRFGTYRWGNYRSFTIFDPKERVIQVAPLRDRIAFHALIDVCEPFFDRVQFHASCACRKGRGQTAAVALAARHTRASQFFLKADVRKYFDSISHDVLKRQLTRLYKDEMLLTAFFAIIDSYERSPGRGIPIGNLTSQFFANHYLNALDRFVFEELKIPRYVRYMDDFVLWGNRLEALAEARDRIIGFTKDKLRLELKPTSLNRRRFGFSFLGYSIRSDGVYLTRKTKIRFRRFYKKSLSKLKSGEYSEAEFARRVGSAVAFLQGARPRTFLTKIVKEYEDGTDGY
ncbi:MAG: hypothetical protein II150_04520 [Thermoguttaceae bacterium]|nr:hypothetical protein [Thermoguttaceae bacterium]